MFLLLHLLIFYNLFIWKPCVSYYFGKVNDRIIGKLNWLSRELLIDAKGKVDSVQHFRKSVHKTKIFQYGTVVFEMRHRLKLMLDLYRKVINDMENSPILDVNAEADAEKSFVNEIAEVDTLAHEVLNFALMLQVRDANLHGDKTKPGYDLFFRRINEGPVWLNLADSLDNNDKNATSEPPPEVNNLNHTGKKRNGVWHYAAPVE